MDIPKISVIVTVFNVEDYITECLESIINQSFIDDMEIIMIDDGSTDRSSCIIDEYDKKYENFHAYHKSNEGISTTRNLGLNLAKGEYIHFFDSDDCIEYNSYESLYKQAKETNCDIIVANSLRFHNYSLWEEHIFKKAFRNLKGNLEKTSFVQNPSLVWDTVTWDKLYKKEFLEKNNLEFPDGIHYYEDILFTFKSFFFANVISISNDFFYYWRFRKSSNSLTQQSDNFKNVEDRFKIINLLEEFIDSQNISYHELLDSLYNKWLTHDLKLCVMKINEYSLTNQHILLKKVNSILKSIPDYVKEDLESFSRILYKMVENEDLDQLLYFAPMENQLKKNTVIPNNLDKKYLGLINFNQDFIHEDFDVRISNIEQNSNELVIKIDENLKYVSDDLNYNIEVYLIDDESNEHSINKIGDDIIIPISSLENNHFTKIKLKYLFENVIKEFYLKNYKRKTLIFDDFDIDFGILHSNLLNINFRPKNNNRIIINDIQYEEGFYIFSGKSTNKISNIVIENILNFEKIIYPVLCTDENILFKIPYSDLIMTPVKKWELKSNDLFDSMRLTRKFTFFRNHDMVVFTNARNKILIKDDIYNKLDYLNNINENINSLNKENNKLKKENKTLLNKNKELTNDIDKLKRSIDEFKSRKIVKFADLIKK